MMEMITLATMMPKTPPSKFTAFGRIASTNASGNSSAPVSYTFTDNKIDARQYYRIIATDMLGNRDYSKIILLEKNTTGIRIERVSSLSGGTTQFLLISGSAKSVGFEILDMQGRRVSRFNKSLVSGLNSFQINTSSFRSGAYVIRSVSEGYSNVSAIFLK